MNWIKRLFGGKPQPTLATLSPETSLKEIEITKLAREYLAGEGDLAIYENYKNGTKSLDFLTGLRTAQIPSARSRIEIPRYPQYSEGIPVTPLEDIIASQRPLIAKIYNASEMSKEDFLALIVPIIWNFAGLVHLLPASQGSHHPGPGGAFRHGLEVAFMAMKSAYDKYIPTSVVAPRYRAHVLKQWYLSIFIAAIGHDLGKLLTDFYVVAAKDEAAQTWNPFTSSLYDWATKNDLQRYYLIWVSRRYRRHEGKGPALLPMLVSKHHLDWIMQHTREPFEAMMACLTAPDPSNNLVARVVLEADAKSSEADSRSRVQNENDPGVIVEQGERIIVATVRRLWRENKWRINEPGGRLWIPDDRTVFVVWDAATKDITEDLSRHAGKALLPDEPEALAALLVESGLGKAFIYQGHEHLLHSIRIPAMASAANPSGPLFYALKADLNGLLGIVTSPSYSAVIEVTPDGHNLDGSTPSPESPELASATVSEKQPQKKPAKQEASVAPAQTSLDLNQDQDIKPTVLNEQQVNDPPQAKDAEATEKRPIRTGTRCLQLPGGRFVPFDQLKQEGDDLLIPVPLAESTMGMKGPELLNALKADSLIIQKPRKQISPVISIGGERFFLLQDPLIVRKEVDAKAATPKQAKENPHSPPSARPDKQGEVGGNGSPIPATGNEPDQASRPKSATKPKTRSKPTTSAVSPTKTDKQDARLVNQEEGRKQSRNTSDPDNDHELKRSRPPSGSNTPYEFYRRELWLRFMEASQETDSDIITMDMLGNEAAWLLAKFGVTYTRPRLLNQISKDEQFYKNTPEGIFIRR